MRALLLLGCAACVGAGDGRLTARVLRPHNPEQRLDVAARAKQCRGGHGVLLEAASEDGNGLLLWLRGDSTTPGEYALRTASDTSAGRAATLSLRYMTGDIGHGLTLDSGVVRLSIGRPRLAGDIVAAGVDLGGAVPVHLTAHFADVAVADTTICSPA
jgi:hypothetical protein